MGLGFIGLGVFLHVQVRDVLSPPTSYFSILNFAMFQIPPMFGLKPEEAYGIMGIECFGALITLTAFLGCCGVIKTSDRMLKGFCVLIAALLLAQIGGGITVWQLG